MSTNNFGMPWLQDQINTAIAPLEEVQVASADDIVRINPGIVLITKGSAIALSLALPRPGAHPNGDDGNQIRFVPVTAFAHVITTATNGFNGNKHILTLVPPSSGLLVAYNGVWYLITNNAGTLT